MSISVSFMRKLDSIPPEIREVLLSLMEELERSREESVTKNEFNELKEIVKELAEAQKKTEQKMDELVEVQKKTEEEVRKLAIGLDGTRSQVGGLSRSMAYALENEAYRNLPPHS